MSDLKMITFIIPCYNSAAFLERGISSLAGAVDNFQKQAGVGLPSEIIIVDDGSTDETLALAQDWQQCYPDIIRVIHQENAGHGGAINHAVREAEGIYLKIVDSDDWLDPEALDRALHLLDQLHEKGEEPDLLFTNYVYEHLSDGTHRVVDYREQFPQGRIFSWQDTHRFPKWKFLMMHSFICRTRLLPDHGISLPEHMSYDDEVFVYETLPKAEKLFYLDCDLYRYVTGRPGQSVNDAIMSRHASDQVRVCRLRIDHVRIPDMSMDKKLERYLIQDLGFSMVFATLTCNMAGDSAHEDESRELWQHLKEVSPRLWKRIRYGFFGFWSFLPGRLGRKMMLDGYHLAAYAFKLN